MRAETLITDGHLSVDNLLPNRYRLVRIYHLFGQRALHTVTSEHNPILFKGCPFDKQLATRAVLENAW